MKKLWFTLLLAVLLCTGCFVAAGPHGAGIGIVLVIIFLFYLFVWVPSHAPEAKKAEPGKALALGLEAGAGTLDLKELSVVLPPSLGGKKVRSVTAAAGGVVVKPTFRQTGNAVRVAWLKPVRVEPGTPLTLEVVF